MSIINIDKMNLLELHKDLVSIDSSEDVSEIRKYILKNLNSDAYIDEKGNVICSKGESSAQYILNTHMDTVSPYIEYNKKGDVIKGRGSCDAKASLAVMINTFNKIKESELNSKITIAITPDEETETLGSKHLSENLLKEENIQGIIVGEPTNLNICTSAKGIFCVNIHVKGKSAHSSNPKQGENAIIKASEIIDVISNFSGDETNHLGKSYLSVTEIKGGTDINTIPEDCRIAFSRRCVDPKPYKEFEEKLKKQILEETDVKNFKIKPLEPHLKPFNKSNSSLAAEFKKHIELKEEKGFKAATEASHFTDNCDSIVVFGPGKLFDEKGEVAHSKREYVKYSQMKKANSVLEKVVKNL